MRVLITRPAEDAEEVAARLRERGHAALIAPLLSLRFHAGPMLGLEGVQAILATSANGVRALAKRTTRRDVAVFAVGPQTAQAASALGFQTVRNADGDAAALAEATRRWASAAGGILLHARGEDGEGGLADTLSARGFKVQVAVLYDVVAEDHLPPDASRALQAGSLDAALFFSPRSARVFAQCMLNAGLNASGLIALCVSSATAAGLSPLVFREVRVAKRPNQEALLACLD